MSHDKLNERINTLYQFIQEKWKIDDQILNVQEKELSETEPAMTELLQKLLMHCTKALAFIEEILPDYNIRAMTVNEILKTDDPEIFLVKGTDLESEKIHPEFQVNRDVFEDYQIKNILEIRDNHYMVFFLEVREDKSVNSIILLDATDNEEKARMLTMTFLINEFSHPVKQFGSFLN